MTRKTTTRDTTRGFLPAQDWRTTDAEEVARRRARAADGKFEIKNLDPRHPVFSNFSVRSDSGRTYAVEVRGSGPGDVSCTCVDFRSNQLGTCKHAEAVRLRLARRHRAEWSAGASARWDVLPDPSGDGLRLVATAKDQVPAALREWFDPDGRLIGDDPDEALAHLKDALATRYPRLRISQDVAPWLEARRRAAERIALRREYERKVQSGEWPVHETRVPLFPYQREGMLHLAFKERALLADEMGLGKTIQGVAACALLHRLGKAKRVLVVTPASLKAEWEEQIRRFTDLPCHLVFGSHPRRMALLRDWVRAEEPGPFFVVMNYEQVLPMVPELNELLEPDVVILDEAQRIKNWNTRIARRIKQLHSRYAFVLTGTPLENRIDELRSLVDFLDPTLLGPLFRFNREFYDFDDRGRPTGYKALDRLHARVKPILLRRRKAEVETELPDRSDRNLFVPMTARQRHAYSAHEQEVMRLVSIAERRPLTERQQERLMIELAMMRMICDSNHILDAEDRECPKLPELGRILEDCAANDAQVIVFSEWERMLHLVRDWCRAKGIAFAWHTGSVPQQKRRAEINRFKNDPSCRVFLSTDAGATGLNLQNASTVVNCDLPWNPARLEQRIARAWRKHQTKPVTVINLVTENSIEQRMLDTLARKKSMADCVLDGDGKVTEIPIRSGRKAMIEQIRGLMTAPAPAPSESRPDRSIAPPVPPPRDRPSDLAADVRRRLGPGLVLAEERRPVDRAESVLLFVVDRKSEAADSAIAALAARHFDGAEPTTGTPRVEVLDRATHEAIQRLIAAGLLRPVLGQERSLLGSDPDLPRALTPEQSANRQAQRDKAARAVRLARLLASGGFAEEARVPLREALLAWARATAIAEGSPEPGDDTALDEEPWTWRLETCHALRDACRRDGPAPLDLEPALRGIEGLLQSLAT